MMKKVYVGSSQGLFKQRYDDHKSSFTHEMYTHKTSLYNYVWEVKHKFGIDLILKWEIVKRCSSNIPRYTMFTMFKTFEPPKSYSLIKKMSLTMMFFFEIN